MTGNPTDADPLLAPPTSFPQAPLLRDERPPLRPSLLDVSPAHRRMENLDALRVLCMAVIIVTHVTEPFLDAAQRRGDHGGTFLAALAVNVACRFGVPCFMMISFFIYWHQLYDKRRTWGELLARRFKRLVPAFVCWSLLYLCIHKLLYRHFGGAAWYTPLADYHYKLTDWRTWRGALLFGQAEYHLYYLPLVMQCLLCVPLLRLLWRRPWVSAAWFAGTVLVWATVTYGPLVGGDGSPARRGPDLLARYVLQPWAIPFLIFPLFGMICAGQRAFRDFIARTPTGLWAGLLCAGVALHVAEAIVLIRLAPDDLMRAAVLIKVGRIVTACAVFVLFVRVPLMRDPFPRVSHYAFGLHFMHPAVILLLSILELRWLGPAVGQWQAHAVPMLAINLLLTFAITYGLCLLVGRVKRLEFLVV